MRKKILVGAIVGAFIGAFIVAASQVDRDYDYDSIFRTYQMEDPTTNP